MGYLIDGAGVFYLIIMGMIGFKRGLIEELGRFVGLVIATLLSFKYYIVVAGKIHEIISIDPIVEIIIASAGIFALSVFGIRIITKFIHIAFLSDSNKWINQFMGVLFGALKGLVILAVFIWLIDILPLDNWSDTLSQESTLVKSNIAIRDGIIDVFQWSDPVKKSEDYIRNITSGNTI